MIKLTKLLAFLALFTLFSCSDDTKDDPIKDPEVPGTEIPKDEVINDTKSLTTVGQSVTEKVPVTAGNSYLFDIDWKEDDFTLEVTLKDPDGINIPLESSSITAKKTGVYTLTITLTEITAGATGPYTFTYTLTEFPPVSASLNGKWLFTKGVTTAYGKTTIRNYSADSAIEVIEIRNDSLISYYYSRYDEEDNIQEYSVPFAESWFAEVKYSIDGNTLTLANGNRLGTNTSTLIKFSGEMSTITWAEEVFTLPTEFIGTWYLAEESEKWTESIEGVEESSNMSETYNSAAESNEIVKITADSVTFYTRNFGTIDSSTSSIAEWYYFFRNKTSTSGMISSDAVYCWVEDKGWEVGNETSTYKSYTGDLPTTEWSVVNIPTTTNPLTVETPFTREVNERDTLWFSVSLNKGEQYIFNLGLKNEIQAGFALFDENKVKVDNFYSYWNDHTYYAKSSGTHFIAAYVEYIYEGSSGTFELTVNQNSDINGNIRSSRAVEPNRPHKIQCGQYLR